MKLPRTCFILTKVPVVSQNLCQEKACDPHSLPNPREGLWHLFPASSKNLIGIRRLFPFLFFPFQQVQGLFCRLVTLDRFIVMPSWQVGLMLFLQPALNILFLFIFFPFQVELCSSFKELMGLLPLVEQTWRVTTPSPPPPPPPDKLGTR